MPIVRAVGGLDDTIIDYTENSDRGTGFKFKEYTKEAMLDAIKRAIKLYENKELWQSLMIRCMKEDYSWERSAKEYMGLYKKAIERCKSKQ